MMVERVVGKVWQWTIALKDVLTGVINHYLSRTYMCCWQ